MALAAAAGVAAAAAYLDGRFHIRRDLQTLSTTRAGLAYAEKHAATHSNVSFFELFEEQVNRLPLDEECLWSRDGILTWKETYEVACKYAGYFREELGVSKNELVAFYLTNGIPYVASLLAVWALGTAPAQLNYNLAGDGLLHCLRTSGTKTLIVDEDGELRARIEESRDKIEAMGIRIAILDQSTRERIMARQPVRPPNELRAHVKGDSCLMLIFTSGTTGFPKAVPFTHARLLPSMGPYFELLGMRRGPGGTRWYSPMPMYHGTGAHVVIMCLCSGATLCIGKKFSVSRFWDEIRASRATAFVYVGETIRYLLAAPRTSADKDHDVEVVFGNGLRPDVWEKFQERFGIEKVSEFFNSSEGVFSLHNPSCRGPFFATSVGHQGLINRIIYRNIIIPVAVDHITGSIYRDPSNHNFAVRVPYSTGGEILVAVADTNIFAGYYKNADATAKRFVRDVFKKGDLYYRSGDALRRDDDGRWYFLDRLGDTFRWKSENVSTSEVAALLGTFPGVVEANVYGVLVPKHDGRAGCAAVYIPPEERKSFDFAALFSHVRKGLPRYAVPVFLRLVSEMSPMHNNKQNKVPLREEGINLEKIKAGSSPGDEMFWVKPGEETYTRFTKEDLEALNAERAKL